MAAKKIYTCTPVSFHADEKFWIRDTGLICRHLQQLGIESRCIMTTPAREDDIHTDDLIRTELRLLKQTSWWKKQQLDGVVLYSWGMPQYLPIARAIRAAGIPFSIHWDGGSDGRPSAALPWYKKPFVHARFRLLDFLWAKHLSLANAVTMAPPIRDFFCTRAVHRHAGLAEKAVASPCPVSHDFRYEGGEKENLIIAIGRWDDEKQKRPQLLMETLEEYYRQGEAATEIYGTMTPKLRAWHAALPEPVRARISLKGYLDNARLKDVYNRARIIVCTSSHESSHIVSAEALCCGCSVVVANRPKNLSVLHWYTTHQSGRIAAEDTPASLAAALAAECAAWQKGERNPVGIAAHWQPHFHADKVYTGIFGLT